MTDLSSCSAAAWTFSVLGKAPGSASGNDALLIQAKLSRSARQASSTVSPERVGRQGDLLGRDGRVVKANVVFASLVQLARKKIGANEWGKRRLEREKASKVQLLLQQTHEQKKEERCISVCVCESGECSQNETILRNGVIGSHRIISYPIHIMIALMRKRTKLRLVVVTATMAANIQRLMTSLLTAERVLMVGWFVFWCCCKKIWYGCFL